MFRALYCCLREDWVFLASRAANARSTCSVISFARSIPEIVICCTGDIERGDGVWTAPACWAVGGDTGVDSALESGNKITLPLGREEGAMIKEESNKNK